MTSAKQEQRPSRWRGRGRVLATDFHIQAALLALERWQRLSADEQSRFRELGTRADGDGKARLSKTDYRELRAIWNKLEVRSLIAEVVKLRARGGLSRGGPR